METSLLPFLDQTCFSLMLFNTTLPSMMPGRRWEQRERRRGKPSTYFSVNPNLNDPIGTQV